MASAEFNSHRTYPDLDRDHTKHRFDGTVVLVTGGCSGIGRSAVERFANDGAYVYALDIRVQGEEELRSQFGDKVSCVQVDVSDIDVCKTVTAQIAAKHDNTINTLFNCAAFFGSKGLDAEKDDWMKSFEVNVVGYSNMVQAVEPYMDKGKNCSIINTASISGHIGQVHRWTYSSTKGAILSLTRCMAVDLREKEIRVNSVSPGWVWTPEVGKACDNNREEGEAKWGRFFMRGKLSEVEHIASVVAFLASKDAIYINGTDIMVDDGYLAMGPEQKGEWSSFAGTKNS